MAKKKPTQACACGSLKFKASMTLVLTGVPVWFARADGRMTYDDTKAEHSDGWDADGTTIECARCGKEYLLSEPDDKDRRTLEGVA